MNLRIAAALIMALCATIAFAAFQRGATEATATATDTATPTATSTTTSRREPTDTPTPRATDTPEATPSVEPTGDVGVPQLVTPQVPLFLPEAGFGTSSVENKVGVVFAWGIILLWIGVLVYMLDQYVFKNPRD